jgi:hypothetical protein
MDLELAQDRFVAKLDNVLLVRMREALESYNKIC